mmetsp:Transcript_55525/g.66787  ORF Transcript_55525/g.66787 Transcript_55525/m.66787 type:complete len:140 (+) Transcript_55525:73-492(+)
MTTNHHHLQLKSREDGFNIDFGVCAKLREYNALHDVNMKHCFENAGRQEYLWCAGQIDRTRRIIADSTKNESEFRHQKIGTKFATRQRRDSLQGSRINSYDIISLLVFKATLPHTLSSTQGDPSLQDVLSYKKWRPNKT